MNQENQKRIHFKNWENEIMSVWWLEMKRVKTVATDDCKEGPEQGGLDPLASPNFL
jgi:hypothetical protein